jgi:superfamily II DNA or RNA helicase
MQERGWTGPKVIFIDETHLVKGSVYMEILKQFPDVILIGLTATPIRLDGKGFEDLYQHLLVGPSIKELQAKERLCMIDTYATEFDTTGMHSRAGDYALDDILEKVDKPKVLANIVKHWEEKAKWKKTLTFCASIAHAQHMADEFTNAGYPSVAVSSKDDSQTIKNKVNAYYAGKYINLVSVQLFIMGFTVKDCECIIQTRPTQSLMIYMQTVGRGMVWLPGKTLINLDCVNNIERHGLPEADREWKLSGKPQNKKKDVTELKRCTQCLKPTPKMDKFCQWCGFEFITLRVNTGMSRTPEETEGKLIKVS